MQCPACHQVIATGSNFCPNCGARFSNQQAQAPVTPPPAGAGAFHPHMGPHGQVPSHPYHPAAPKRNKWVRALVWTAGVLGVLGVALGAYTLLRIGKAKEVALTYVQAMQQGDRTKVCAMHVYKPWCEDDLARFKTKHAGAKDFRVVRAMPNGWSERRGLLYDVDVEFTQNGATRSITIPIYPDSSTPASVFMSN